MRKIIFYTELKWAFGSIHNCLAKNLYQYGIDCELIDFFENHSIQVLQCINNNIDYFVTNYPSKLIKQYNIPANKIIFVAHSEHDMLFCIKELGDNIFFNFHKFGVVSNILKEKSYMFGINRIPEVVTLGIDFYRFYSKPSEKLTNIGIAGAFESFNFNGIEIKRGRLVHEICQQISIPLIIPYTKMHYMGMPSFYKTVNSIVVASTEEGAGLPVMEGAAAGKLIMSTAVGNFRENGPRGGGIVLPIEEDSFKKKLSEYVKMYASDKEAYIKKCLEIQEYARENYDWSKHIENWVTFLS